MSDRRGASGMKQWTIAIGINQYQFFQPLTYAQRDAQALRHILASEAGFSPERCILLSDNSPPVRGKSTYPNRENMLDWLDHVCREVVQPGDILWLFFSGYGACYQGQDYLMPLEGNPTAIATTGIPLTDLFKKIQASAATTLVLLDINRSQGAVSYEEVGRQTAQLAQQTGVPTILSCQPGQFSHEVATLRQGLFTATLVECLRHQQCTTLASLDRYLNHRLPELSEHSWQPIQQPLTICQPEQLQQVILPRVASPSTRWNSGTENELLLNSSPTINGVQSGQPNATTIATALDTMANGKAWNNSSAPIETDTAPLQRIVPLGNGQVNGHHPGGSEPSTDRGAPPVSTANTSLLPNGNGHGMNQSMDKNPMTKPNDNSLPPSTKPANSNPSMALGEELEVPDAKFWPPMLLWGGLLTAFLLVGVFWRNWSTFFPTQSVMAQTPQPIQPLPPQVSSTPTNNGTIVASNQTIAASQTAPKPATAPIDFPPQPVASINNSPSNRSLDVQSLDGSLMQALVRNDHASPFSSAIQDAGKIQPGQPGYEQAQQNIALWSQAIYTIALQRAQRQHYDTAVQAAVLVPPSQAELYNKARTAVSQEWCPSLSKGAAGPLTLQEAKKLCGQKS